MVAACSVAKPCPDFEILGLESILKCPSRLFLRQSVGLLLGETSPGRSRKADRPTITKTLSRKRRRSYPVHTA